MAPPRRADAPVPVGIIFAESMRDSCRGNGAGATGAPTPLGYYAPTPAPTGVMEMPTWSLVLGLVLGLLGFLRWAWEHLARVRSGWWSATATAHSRGGTLHHCVVRAKREAISGKAG